MVQKILRSGQALENEFNKQLLKKIYNFATEIKLNKNILNYGKRR